jgi:diketogulonate reductase-like aldo/keto reductase
MEFLTLSNGVKMPLEGFGVFQVPEQEVCKDAVLNAIKNGYRLIDTAALYMNEKAVGRGMKASGKAREEIYLSTKLWPSVYATADEAIDATLKRRD